MNSEQFLLFCILGSVFVFFIWGRLRYDIVAFAALVLAVLCGLVPVDAAFSGFGHPATVVVALVLVVSTGLVNSGAIFHISKNIFKSERSLRTHITLSGSIGAILSAFMNNVATLALLMPADVQNARKSKWSPRDSLMPLSFATILGGMVTMIGTPPNIIVSTVREEYLGQPYSMFDFSYVGLIAASAGLLFISIVGWRLIPKSKTLDAGAELLAKTRYHSELTIPEVSNLIGKTMDDLHKEAIKSDVYIRGFVRGKLFHSRPNTTLLMKGDTLLLDSTPDSLDEFRTALSLDFSDGERQKIADEIESLNLCEAVVPVDSRIAGRTVQSIGLFWRKGAILLGISRKGRKISKRVRKVTIKPGDLLLLLVPEKEENNIVNWLGCLAMIDRGLTITQGNKLSFGVGVFGLAIVLASVGVVQLPLGLAIVVVIYAVTKLINTSEIYESVEWSVIILLGSMIPLGLAMTETGSTALVVDGVMDIAHQWPAWMVLTALMVVTMTLSDVLNNTATALIAAPIGVEMADRLGVSADPFLMAVAIAASCAFLTPIGHKNNTLIMGPGGYGFSDYWRIGLPLELLIIGVSVPSILFFWPL